MPKELRDRSESVTRRVITEKSGSLIFDWMPKGMKTRNLKPLNELSEGFEVTILDDFSTGQMQNISHHRNLEEFHVVRGDVRDIGLVKKVVEDVDAVFHEAALGMCRFRLKNHFYLMTLIS